MSRRMLGTNWISLAEAAQSEQDPKRFMMLIKQLYDVLNMRENETGTECDGATRAELQSAA